MKIFSTTFWVVLLTVVHKFIYSSKISATSADCDRKNGEFKTEITPDFYDLVVNHNVFVDKSLLIQDLLERIDGEVVLITQPRGYGKTVNADMLRRFLEIEVNKNGEPLPQNDCINRKLFVGGKIDIGPNKSKELKPLKISSNEDIMKYQGKVAVIFINLKDITGINYYQMESSIRKKMESVLSKYEYLKRNTKLQDIYKTSFDFYGKDAKTNLERSVESLSDLLSKHFDSDVFIIVDDYETPIINSYMEFANTKDLKDIQDLLSRIFRNSLETNKESNLQLKGGLITGVLPVYTINLNVNPIAEYTLLDERITKYYGLTGAEIKQLLSKVQTKIKMEEIKLWYYGYKVQDDDIYSPRSIMRCLLYNETLGQHWREEDEKSFVIKVFLSDGVQDDLHNLITGEKMLFSFTKSIDFSYFEKHTLLLNILSHSGYITPLLEKTSVSDRPKFISSYCVPPNKEVEGIIKSNILRWVWFKLSVESSVYDSIVKLLRVCKIQEFKEKLQDLIFNAIYFTPYEETTMVFYRAFVLSLVHVLSDSYALGNAKYTGKPKTIMTLLPKSKNSDNAIILYYDIVETSAELKPVAEAGLEKITKEQLSNKIDVPIKKILKISVAFYMKNFTLEYKIDHL